MLSARLFRISLLALLLLANLRPAVLHALPRPGQAAPNFRVITTSGQSVSMDNYRGYVLLLDFFAPWCIPCRASAPHIVDMKRKYGRQGLQVLGLNADDDGGGMRSFADECGITYPLAAAGERVQNDFGIRSVPVMFVIDKKGVVAEIYRGFNDEIGRSMEALIRRLLAER